MSDDFGTVNAKQKGREIELLRQHYLRHRESIGRLIADAPTEHLAAEYQRVVAGIDAALSKIAEIEGRPGGSFEAPPPPVRHPARNVETSFLRAKTQPATMPLDPYDPDATQIDDSAAYSGAEPNPKSRVALIVIAGVLVLAVIGWMIWRGRSNDDAATTTVAESTVTESTTVADGTVAPAPALDAGLLAITPESADYGTIRKGTRTIRQFDLANNTEEPISIQLARSNCRCLFYDHAEVVPPRGKETITVTIDGARAKSGALRESVKVSSKKDPTIFATFDVSANIQ